MILHNSYIFLLLFLTNYTNAQIQPFFGVASGPRNGPCKVRPPACALNCAYGFAWGLTNECLCLCQVNPCASRICPLGEQCQNQAGFAVCVRAGPEASILRPITRQPASIIRSNTVGECPHLIGGKCTQQCQQDSDCLSPDFKCCSNGCGFDCVKAVNVAPIQGSLSIRPIGQFPQLQNLLSTLTPTITPAISNSIAPSTHDFSSASKGACVNLLSAVQHLPQKHLQSGFVPTCTANGKFAPVQCDQEFCWCASVDTGHELWGTKVPLDERADLNCAAPRQCDISVAECERKTKGHCTFGFETDSNGCPSIKCECKQPCASVECDRKYHECQLIEPDCAEPPCQPVPKCILNPCPNGPPATLNNGVTALCTSDNPCFPGFWCHEIGYNGLGFCCPEPENAKRDNVVCEAKAPRRSTLNSANEQSECRVDSDCPESDKCCFDGTALKCTHGRPISTLGIRRPTTVKTGVLSENKALLSSLAAECPEFEKPKRALTCETECQTDADCHGMRRCCKNGCSQVCVYPVKTTACLHDAITFDLFGLKHPPRCNSHGLYHEIQCDQERCYCAEPNKGHPLPGTLVPTGHRPTCNRQRSCIRLNCPNSCKHGTKYDEEGCPVCECKSPCEAIQCGHDQVCMMIKVECTNEEECPEQPRCLPNICQGNPSVDLTTDLPIQCDSKCPTGFACIQFGLPSNRGLCCPLGISGRGGVRPTTHVGECPQTNLILGGVSTSPLRCRADADCASHERCCFDGKSTMCTVVDKRTTPKSKLGSTQKPGECSSHVGHRQDCRSGVDECTNDQDCAGILKCCSDGCYKKCLPAQITTACHHLKSAMEPFGRSHQVRCSSDGDFESVQCDSSSCWCVNIENGREIEGTRAIGSLKPECRMRRVCSNQACDLKCANGFKKDANGCSICECVNVCQDLKCPSSEHVCVPQAVKCLEGTHDCPLIPVCIPNVCRSGHPLEKSGEIRECDTNGDCPSGSYCRRFGWRRGYCCGGPDNQRNPGKCPKQFDFPVYSQSCSLKCRQDNDCPNNEACCFNGCGMECAGGQKSIQPSRQLPVHLHSIDQIGKSNHHSQPRPSIEAACPLVQDLGHSVCGSSRDNLCESDKECPTSLKCCFDGCSRSCMPPSVASNCVHASGAVQALMRMGNANLFQPLCTADGLYARVQRQRDLEWCVDQHTGREIPGTRTNSGVANCDQPRECRALTCQLDCSQFGYQIDEDGCEQCACQDPCHNIHCSNDHVCRMTQMECGSKTGDCQPQPKCILNVCLRGEPLTKANTRLLVHCNIEHKQQCPPGWFCQQIGLDSGGYCCAGILPDSQLQLSASKCSPTPILYSEDASRQRRIECRLQKDCGSDRPCCFNGYGTQCVRILGRSSLTNEGQLTNNKLVAAVQPEGGLIKPIKPILSQSDRGVCPLNSFHNPGCQTECHSDEECSEFSKCCEFGCGRKCMYPELTSPCVHRLAVLEEESLKKNGRKANASTNSTSQSQCASNRQYRRIQCQREIGQCWCVDVINGKEMVGTRSSIVARGEPNCQTPRKCPVDCKAEWTQCEHGVRLDSNGCPANNQCECRNPCEDFVCASEGDICVLRAVKCQPKEPCPKQPTCRPSPCASQTQPMRNQHSVALTCRRDSECALVGMDETTVECRALATSDDENGHKVGVCCGPSSVSNAGPSQQSALGQAVHAFEETAISTKMGVCPLKRLESSSTTCQRKCSADDDCSGFSKCCKYGCSTSCERPAPATNCMHMTIAIEKLKNDGVPTRLSLPACDHELGTYVNNQCDENGLCWCVDKSTGAEVTATRRSQPAFNACEGEKRKCSVECSEDLTQTCPFGLDLDQNGCPKTSQCRCKNPCDYVDCPKGEICLLRSRDCTEDLCLPVPQCESNYCSDEQRPLLEARGFSQFACFHNRTRPCPTSYQCTGFDQREIGICCPPPLQRSSLHFHQDADQNGRDQFASCLHGPAYTRSNDDPPIVCSLNGQNACPSTHYCVTKPGQSHGNCCPTKRFVCNLEKDIATACGRPTTRFHFDPESQQCIPFVYGGCSGNLNNFETETACQKFCVGVGSNPLGQLFDESDESLHDLFYNVGFSLLGPLNRQKHTDEFNERLRDYIMATYSLSESELRDLYVKDDNTVRFNLVTPNAQQKAENISQAVASGRFHFRYGDDNYRAEPQSWHSHQIDTNMRPAISGALFWILLITSTLFAVAVVFILWCACSFVRTRSKDSASIFRSNSPPSQFGQISAYLPQDAHSSRASSRASNRVGPANGRPQSRSLNTANGQTKVQSADDLHTLQQMERENRRFQAAPSALAQFLSNPLQEQKIQRPRVINNQEDAGPSRKVVSGQKSTVFY